MTMGPLASVTITLGDVDKDHRVDVSAVIKIGPLSFSSPAMNLDLHVALSLVTGAFSDVKKLFDGGK